MPRILQKEDEYRQSDFWLEINRRCPCVGVQSDNLSTLATVTSVSLPTISKYRNGGADAMRIKTLSALVRKFDPDPAVVLRLIGYSNRQIADFRRSAP